MDQNITNSANSKPSGKTQDASVRKKKNAPRVKTPRKITASYLHNAGLYYLQRYSSSAGNFRRVMMRKIRKSCAAHPDQDIEECTGLLDALIPRFEELGLLDDETYARAQVGSLRRSGKSARHIKGKLAAKALPSEEIERALERHSNESGAADDELEAARTYARKKRLGPWRGEKEKPYDKQLAAMARAGFSYEMSKKVLDNQDIDDGF